MDSNLVAHRDPNPRPMVSSPPSVNFLALRRIGTDEDGTVVLRRGTALTDSQRTEAESYLAGLRFSLHNGATDTDLMMALALLFAPYENRERTPEAEKMRLVAYVQVLQGYPLWAVQDAVKWWHRGEHSEPADNRSFAPAPAALVRLVNIAIQPAQEAERKVAGLLRARVEDDHPAPQTPAERERMTARVDALVADFAAVARKRAAEVSEAVAEGLASANATLRQRDFEAHGMEYDPSSLAASPALLTLLGKGKQDGEAA